MARVPRYRILVRQPDAANFGPGTLIAEFHNAKNIGWSEYLNNVGECFFTVTQGDSKLPLVAEELQKGLHVQIYRTEFGDAESLVFAGWLGESDETETDVVFYGYSYVAGLFWLHSGWAAAFTGSQLDVIVTDIWTNLRGRSNSALGWTTTGTIEVPVTTSGGSTAIVLPSYTVHYKRGLFMLQEVAGMAASDTTNIVTFEITPAGVFNFWKNRSTVKTSTRWEYGGLVMGYRRLRSPMDRRNFIYGVGSAPRDILMRREDSNVVDMAANSRREEAIFYEWVRDATELERVNKLRLTRGIREDNQLSLSFVPGRVVPFRATGAHYSLGDSVPVFIDHGATQVDENKLVTGQQIVVVRGQEHVRVLMQDSQ